MSLDRIPAGRRVAVLAAHNLARQQFADDTGAGFRVMQRSLTRLTDASPMLAVTAVDRFADVQHAGEFGSEDKERAVEALGDLACVLARMCEVNALALRPICDLARVYTKHESTAHTLPLLAAGLLCNVVGNGSDSIRLVDAIGLVLAKAIDEVEIVHELTIDLPGVFQVVAMETIAGKLRAPRERLEMPPISDDVGRVERAFTMLKGGLSNLEQAEHAEGTGDFDVSDLRALEAKVMSDVMVCSQCGGLLSQGSDTTWTCANGHHIIAVEIPQ